ncbi:MAG TPA: hypothetical protein VFE96_06470 [Candidatus Bathyarchaeia archaeon]|nr:hypothetical protein [Candidatus Bathyarchaeia archaeon]
MPVKIIHPNHLEIVGSGKVLLTTPHAASIDADIYAGTIVEEVALTSRSFAVIGKVKGEFQDPSKALSAQSEFEKSIEGFVTDDGVKFRLEIRGRKEPGVEIRTAVGEVCSDSTLELVRSRLAKDFAVNVNSNGEVGRSWANQDNNSKESRTDALVEIVRVEFGPDERQFQKERVINNLSEIVDLLNAQFASSRRN